ncbi:MAG TPA: RHS repeat-associated core domain-containing protein, partial [Solirubrobacteraceae bacterium]|nr:RHS repeat-associated core domain-containing protein [Solirubrobacteraceae bacterium]
GYDAAGNQTSVTDPLGRVTSKGYDAANRLTSIGYSDGSTPNVTIGYDPDNQQSSLTDGTGTSTWAWDSLHRITSYTDGHGDSASFGWDLAGHKTSITYPGSHVVSYGYDAAGRMSSMTDWLSHTTSFGYDPDSDPASTTFPTATSDVDSFGFDRADRQTSSVFAQGSSTLASVAYTRDNKGLITQTTSTGLPAGDSHAYGYNTLDQLTSDNADSYAYDAADNPTTLMSAGPNSFDAANELTATPAATFGYNSLGERTSTTPTGGSATTYGYDQAGRLASYTPPTGPAASYAYDGSGLRMSKTVGTTTTHFLWDPTGTLPLLLSDGSTNYLYGPDGNVTEQIDAGGIPTYYHHDQLGSTRLLTDSTGAATATFSYTPYGGLAGSTGTQSTPIGYAGEYTDPETGFQYLRARYYDPGAGQFLTRDPLLQQTREAYVYTHDNPVSGSDPSGKLMPGEGGTGRCDWGGCPKVAKQRRRRPPVRKDSRCRGVRGLDKYRCQFPGPGEGPSGGAAPNDGTSRGPLPPPTLPPVIGE